MVEGTNGTELLELYNSFVLTMPSWAQNFINLFLLVLLIVLYSVFIWKFYRFIATKNILELNLNKYNKATHPFLTKLFAGILYLVEYILILPFLIFFWFAIFTLFLIFLTEGLEIKALLLISVSIIGAIRMISYIPKYGENLAKDLAKLLPFTLLAISVLNPSFFSIERIFKHFDEIPGFFYEIITYLLFIVCLEVILRFFDFIFSLFGLEEIQKTKEDIKKNSIEEEE